MTIRNLNHLMELIRNADPAVNDLPDLLRALCKVKSGDWSGAHDLADSIGGRDGDWLHAYLHRYEGDLWNADYWYRRAGRDRPDISLDEEWDQLAEYLIKQE